MLGTMYQGGPSVEIFNPQGKLNRTAVGLSGRVKHGFDQELKANCLVCDGGGSTSKIEFPNPKQQKKHLGMTQRYLAVQLQLSSQPSDPFCLEIAITDTQRTRRRMVVSSGFRTVVTNPLHAQLPLAAGYKPNHEFAMMEMDNDFVIPRGIWFTLYIDLNQLTSSCFREIGHRSLDSLTFSGFCKIRKIFTLKDIRAPIPKDLNFPSALANPAPLVEYSLEAVRHWVKIHHDPKPEPSKASLSKTRKSRTQTIPITSARSTASSKKTDTKATPTSIPKLPTQKALGTPNTGRSSSRASSRVEHDQHHRPESSQSKRSAASSASRLVVQQRHQSSPPAADEHRPETARSTRSRPGTSRSHFQEEQETLETTPGKTLPAKARLMEKQTKNLFGPLEVDENTRINNSNKHKHDEEEAENEEEEEEDHDQQDEEDGFSNQQAVCEEDDEEPDQNSFEQPEFLDEAKELDEDDELSLGDYANGDDGDDVIEDTQNFEDSDFENTTTSVDSTKLKRILEEERVKLAHMEQQLDLEESNVLDEDDQEEEEEESLGAYSKHFVQNSIKNAIDYASEEEEEEQEQDDNHDDDENDAGETTNNDDDTATGSGGQDGELDLMFDPILNCYFCPKTNKYYRMK